MLKMAFWFSHGSDIFKVKVGNFLNICVIFFRILYTKIIKSTDF